MKGHIFAVAIVAILLGVTFVGIDAQHERATVDVEVENEEHTLYQNNSSRLDAADEWESLEEISVETSDGVELQRPQDYELNESTGEIWASDTEYDGADVYVSYSYSEADEETELLASLMAPFTGLLGLLLLLVCCGTLYAWLGGFGGGR